MSTYCIQPVFNLIVGIVFLLVISAGTVSHAADTDQMRPYLAVRVGGTYFVNPSAASEIDLENPPGEAFAGGAIGLNFNRYWGAELAAEFSETDLLVPGATGKVVELAMWTFLVQGRLRYPMWNDRLTPYLLLGAGVGIAEPNDRNLLNSGGAFGLPAIPLHGGLDTSFVGAVGTGLEYFVTDNVALGVEVKHRFLFRTDVNLRGQSRELDLDSVVWSSGMRVYFDRQEHAGGPRSAAADSDELRPYLALRAGAAFFTDPDAVPQAKIETPTLFGGAAVGLNLNKYWGVELAGEGFETELRAPNNGEISEYSFWTALAHVRLRHSVLENRLVSYLLLGGGIGFGELNDRRVRADVSGISGNRTTTFVGSLGVGLEYFVADNIALGVEAKHLFLYDSEITVDGRPTKLQIDPIFASLGLRIYF
jgi:opacity protein-like surface antigen